MGRLLSYDELKPLKGIRYTRQHLLVLERQNKFPARIPLSGNMVAWDEKEIDQWVEQKKKARVAPAPSPRRAAG